MTYQHFEDEPPCIHYRSAFDTEPPPAIRCAPTEPCPPSFACDDAAPVALVTRKEPDSDGFNPAACHGVTHAGFEFPGGVVVVEKPTREALLLSAKQWATAVRECWFELYCGDSITDPRMLGKLDRLDAVLAELAAL
ncbi:MAG: hypothetical protein RL033_3513 [Pseudomonadota bacterium]|jgi:hypothetical protein